MRMDNDIMTASTLRFTKMHGLGNDFVVINNMQAGITFQTASVAQLANRHLGIGFDQLLVLEPSDKADFFCRIFNADGQEAEQCGNGLRCVARFARDQLLLQADNFTIETKAGLFPIQILNNDSIRVGLGAPVVIEQLVSIPLQNSPSIPTTILSLGNPHAIVKVDDAKSVPDSLAAAIATTDYFPQGVNLGFMQVINSHHVRLRTFERGVGQTHACGSNACAAAIAGILNGWLDHQVKVEYLYGSLLIDWDKDNNSVYITGPAVTVFQGEIKI